MIAIEAAGRRCLDRCSCWTKQLRSSRRHRTRHREGRNRSKAEGMGKRGEVLLGRTAQAQAQAQALGKRGEAYRAKRHQHQWSLRGPPW